MRTLRERLRALPSQPPHEGLVVECQTPQRVIAASARPGPQAAEVGIYVSGQDADHNLKRVAEGVAGDDPFLLQLRLEGEVDALRLEDSTVVAAAQTEHAVDDVLQRQQVLDARVPPNAPHGRFPPR